MKEITKKKKLGTSHTWSLSRSSHRLSDPACYIEDCRISEPQGRTGSCIVTFDIIDPTKRVVADVVCMIKEHSMQSLM